MQELAKDTKNSALSLRESEAKMGLKDRTNLDSYIQKHHQDQG